MLDKEFFAAMATIMVLLITFVSVIFGAAYFFERTACNSFGELYQIEVKYILDGCQVKIDGEFVPKHYVFGEAHEIRIK